MVKLSKEHAAKVEEVLTRSVDSIYPSKEALKKVLLSGRKIRVYVGIDPTADYVHIGHATNYLLLERLHELGHKIIVLVGDFTAMIGDPSDKTAARVRLTRKEIQRNLKTFKSQIGKILSFKDKKNPIEFRFNSEWLAKLDFEKMAEIASNFTVQQMLERDMFEKRIAEKKPLYVHEFFYPLLQGYDSVAMKVDLEVGGTDQTFNMLAGRTLVKRYLNREKYVITTTLLVNPKTGEKMMSKSAGTGIGLNESTDSMFGKVMALPDEGIIQLFTDCTRVPMEEIRRYEKKLKQGVNPKDVKLALAQEIVALYHGKTAAEKAAEKWEKLFSKKETSGADLPTLKVPKKVTAVDLVLKSGVAKSRGEAWRLVEQGGLKIGDKTIKNPRQELNLKGGEVVKVGKKSFLKTVLS